MKKIAFCLRNPLEQIFAAEDLLTLNRLGDPVYPKQLFPEQVRANPALLRDVEVLFTGWGCPPLDEHLLALAPHLEAVFHAAGSVRSIVSEAFWEREIIICSAWGANAVPVAEFTLAQVVLCLKQTYHLAALYRRQQLIDSPLRDQVLGVFGTTVGLISLGMIGRLVAKMLQPLNLRVLAYDPYIDLEEAAHLGVTLVDLDAIFRESHVVSLHTPWLKETENMIRGRHLAAMKSNAAFINTARGAIVNENEMIDVLRSRSDLTAVIDVTHPEPPVPDSPLWSLPNVVLTPHVAGSIGRECWRMGHYMTEEFDRFLNDETLQWRVTGSVFARMA